jgi:rhodanese-related sulfurtransferase
MIKTITLTELKNKLSNLSKNELILDVRRAEEFAAGHIPGSKNISHELISQFTDELKNYDCFYMYCRSGGRVQKAALDLMNHGVKNFICIIDGGFPDWEAKGFPVER